ncbi:unnamed protein product [Blepharisma stoltei]|uniref:Uncharacterized protein n=1 Tax=Blepharisma stoltei TaxID=1481888 RepID=A0AAU9IYP9_9CILI|nr:unnamed protein product [Blepharisma stoltei]
MDLKFYDWLREDTKLQVGEFVFNIKYRAKDWTYYQCNHKNCNGSIKIQNPPFWNILNLSGLRIMIIMKTSIW